MEKAGSKKGFTFDTEDALSSGEKSVARPTGEQEDGRDSAV